MSWRWRGDGGGSNDIRWLLLVAASSSSCCLLLSLPLSCVYSVLRCFLSGGGGRWSGQQLGGEMTMIPGGGATVFSSPPLCRARGLCFFSSLSVLSCFSSPSLVLLALAALTVAGWRCCCGGGKETWRWCPGGEERSFFFSVLRPPVSVLLFPTSVLAFSPLSLKQIFLFFFLFPSVSVSLFSTLEILPPLFCSLSVSSFSPFPRVFSLLCIYSQAERESPLPCSIKTQEGNKATLPLQGKVAGCLQGMGCINGGRVGVAPDIAAVLKINSRIWKKEQISGILFF